MRNFFYCQNCLEVLKGLPDEHVDLILTSPPYDNLRNYEQATEWNFETFSKIAQELFRVLKKGGVLVWVVGDATHKGSETLTSFKQAIHFKEVCGFNLHDTMIYYKQGAPLTHKRYEQHFEYMFVFSKGKPKTFNGIRAPAKYGGREKRGITTAASSLQERANKYRTRGAPSKVQGTKLIGNVWQFSVGGGHSTRDKIAFQHPAIFPEKLATDHIITWSNPGEVVLDPFAGSGTTAKCAHLLNRFFICTEISKHYCQIAQQRLSPYVKNSEDIIFNL